MTQRTPFPSTFGRRINVFSGVLVALALIASVFMTAPGAAFAQQIDSGYASVNGLEMYYEIHGDGEPLILLHGGVGTGEMFNPLLPELTENRQIITVDLQAHGRTADIDRPLRYEFMADDIAALMELLGIEEADLMGYSLGAGVALQTAIRHPEVVDRLVVISAPFARKGWYPEVRASTAQLGHETAKNMKQSPLYEKYPNVNWPVLFTKIGELTRQDYNWSKEVAAIEAPVMLIFADVDAVHTEHIMAFYGLLGGGKRDAGLDGSKRPTTRLAILPGVTHYTILSHPALAAHVTRFLEASLPEAK